MPWLEMRRGKRRDEFGMSLWIGKCSFCSSNEKNQYVRVVPVAILHSRWCSWLKCLFEQNITWFCFSCFFLLIFGNHELPCHRPKSLEFSWRKLKFCHYPRKTIGDRFDRCVRQNGKSCAIVVEALLMVFPKILHNVPFDDSDAVRIRQRQQVVFGASPCWNQDSKNDKPLRWRNGIWVFPKIGEPQNGWFIMENPIKMGWFGGTPIFGNPHIDRGLSQ